MAEMCVAETAPRRPNLEKLAISLRFGHMGGDLRL